MMASDAQLVRELRSVRGEAAARELYRAYGGELYGFAVTRLRDSGAAEEVVQDVFSRAWRHAADYDATRASVRTWLYAIARNVIIDIERCRERRPRLSGSDGAGSRAAHEPIERALLGWQVQLAFERLTPEHREVVALAHLEGWTLRDIAERLEIPVGTVKSRAFYGLESLRLALEELGVTP